MLFRTFSLITLILTSGCGDILVGPEFLGDPAFELEGSIVVSPGYRYPDNIEIAVVWPGIQEQETTTALTRSETKLPASFKLSIFDQPEALSRVPDHDTASFAIGQLLAYEDRNGNQKLELGEPIVGNANNRLVTFFDERGTSDIVGEFDGGFNIHAPVDCLELDVDSKEWIRNPTDKRVEVALAPFDITAFAFDLGCDTSTEDACFNDFFALENLRVLADDDHYFLYLSTTQAEFDQRFEAYERSYKTYYDAVAEYPEICVEVFGDGDCSFDGVPCLPKPDKAWAKEIL